MVWLGGDGADPLRNAERRAEGLIEANLGAFRALDVRADLTRRRGEPFVRIETGTTVGAVPLLSPISGRLDYGLCVRPRFDWDAVGLILAAAGMRCIPALLPFPALPQSERTVPPWVLASVVLARVESLLDSQRRRFRWCSADLPAPRGTVRWDQYVQSGLAAGNPLAVPCTFPDLDDDERLLSAIRWVLIRQRGALLAQRGASIIAQRLLNDCERLLVRVSGVPPMAPSRSTRAAWDSEPMRSKLFREGVEAIGWTVDERGLAGLSDTTGLAWRLPMEQLFEAVVEAASERCARRIGAQVRVGRTEQTRMTLRWSPPGSGSLRSLAPDVLMRREGLAVVVDAKYKPHAELIARQGWDSVSASVRESHRADIHQVLAYSSTEGAARVVACLAYPVHPSLFPSLIDRGRAAMRTTIRHEGRCVDLVLLAFPLNGDLEFASKHLEVAVCEAIANGSPE